MRDLKHHALNSLSLTLKKDNRQNIPRIDAMNLIPSLYLSSTGN